MMDIEVLMLVLVMLLRLYGSQIFFMLDFKIIGKMCKLNNLEILNLRKGFKMLLLSTIFL